MPPPRAGSPHRFPGGRASALLAREGDVGAGEALAREAVELALGTRRVDTQTEALMDLGEVLRVAGRPAAAVPVVEDALRRYELKEVFPQPPAHEHSSSTAPRVAEETHA